MHKKDNKQVARTRGRSCSPLAHRQNLNWYAKGLRTAPIKTVCFGGVHEATHITPLNRFRVSYTGIWLVARSPMNFTHTESDSISVITAHFGFT